MISRRLLKVLSETILILEQEEEGGDLFGDDEGGDEEEAEPATDEGGDEEEADEAADEEEEGEEEEAESVYPLGKAVDDEINALFVDYEEEAIKSAAAIKDEVKESLSIVNILYEQDKQNGIDLEIFAKNVARLAKNYDNLLDMEDLILTKALEFIRTYHDDESGDVLEDLLDTRFGLSLGDEEDIIAPMAMGASPTAAEGGV